MTVRLLKAGGKLTNGLNNSLIAGYRALNHIREYFGHGRVKAKICDMGQWIGIHLIFLHLNFSIKARYGRHFNAKAGTFLQLIVGRAGQ